MIFIFIRSQNENWKGYYFFLLQLKVPDIASLAEQVDISQSTGVASDSSSCSSSSSSESSDSDSNSESDSDSGQESLSAKKKR